MKRDRRAEYDMYKATYSYLMSICIRYTRNQDTAKEVLNIGFLKILSSLGNYRPEVPFNLWIRKIMINTLIDEFRKKKAHIGRIEYVEDYDETRNFSEMNHAIKKINAEQIYSLIDKLPYASQQVFNLYVIDGYAHKEIADLLKISEGTSKWHLNFARTKLKELINNIVPSTKIA